MIQRRSQIHILQNLKNILKQASGKKVQRTQQIKVNQRRSQSEAMVLLTHQHSDLDSEGRSTHQT